MKTCADVVAIREHYDRLSPFYARFWGEHIHHGFWQNGESPSEAQQKLVEELARRAGITRAARVLDVGCGMGGSASWLARELGCSVLGITLSPVQVALATKHARAQGLDRLVQFQVHDANQLELPGESFDAVWSVECLEHLSDKPRFLSACFRALKPGGRLAATTWLGHAESNKQQALIDRICRGMLCPSLGSLQDYLSWMRDSGFAEVAGEDIAPRVAKTWTLAEAIADRPEVKLLLRATTAATREFAATFKLMGEAYAVGAMGYGLFTARKPAPAHRART